MLRAIREIQPRWVVGENVFGIVNWSGGLVFHEVQTDLEAEGYEVWPYVLPACAVNAPHRRDRIWFVAYSGKSGGHQKNRDLPSIAAGLLPTPTTQEPTTISELTETGRRKTTDGNDSHSLNIGRMAAMGLLPTPTAMDSTGATANMKSTQVKEGSMHSMTLSRLLLPTPTADDSPAKNTGKRNQDGLQKRAFQATGKTSQLNPRFVAEMMNYPIDWLELPFLNTETKA
jgi:site-specific DNA-cytosine methylase